MTSAEIAIERNPHGVSAEQRAEILADPGFGRFFTDHMFVAEWTPDARVAQRRCPALWPVHR